MRGAGAAGMAPSPGGRTAMTDLVPVITTAVVVARDERTVPLRSLGIASENLRFNEPPDDDIPVLASTMKAAGQLERLTVRPGRGKKEQAFMALNGRRRLLALGLLLQAGEIDGDYPVQIYVETDPARQAAAVLLTNTAAPVHVADVIAAIGRMLKAKLTVETMARALGYAEIEVRRLAALSGLPPVALDALKSGRLTLKQARSLTRLTNRKEQVELAEAALAGYGFQEWRITERLGAGRVTIRDRRCALVSPEQYADAGGRIETDLFDELPAVLLDPDTLSELWLARVRAIALTFEAEGIDVHVTAGAEPEMPEDLEPLGYRRDGLDEGELAAWREARDRYLEAVDAARDTDTTTEQTDDLLVGLIRAKIALDQAGVGGRAVTAVIVWPAASCGIDLRCYAPEEPEPAIDPDVDAFKGDAVTPTVRSSHYEAPRVEAPVPETDGVTHALHAVRTDVATRGLIRALADDPGAALAVLIARLFSVLVAGVNAARSDSISTVTATAFGSRTDPAIETLDGVVREQLDARRAAWQASGQTVLAWVGLLPHGEKMAFLAELTAISLDGREARTDLIRNRARAEAAEVADLVGADIAHYWTPDVRFLRPHSKTLLLGMLVEMQVEDVRAGSLKKDELVDWVAEQAASHAWAPSNLSWSLGADEPGLDPSAEDETVATGNGGSDLPVDGPDDDLGDGSGAFVVTPAGEAVLETAAA